MRVFYLLAIVFVVDGHMSMGHMFEMNGLFRYYSFHLMMFAFGSGYFFKLYGKPLSDLVREGLSNKLMHMPEDTQLKVQQTLEKIINEGNGGMVCILL